MGLFSRKKKEKYVPEYPAQYYLDQLDVDILMGFVYEDLKVYLYKHSVGAYTMNWKPMFYNTDDLEKQGRISEDTSKALYYFTVKHLSARVISLKDILETAAKKGSGIAAIYLALHYEHGIDTEKDPAKANSYYSMAQTVDPSVIPIIDIINAVKQKMWFRYDWCTDQDETLAVNLWFNNNAGWHESDVSHCDMVAALDSRLRTDYLRLTTWLLFYYASTNNSVWAKGMLGFALKSYREYVQSNRLYDFISNETVEDIDKTGFTLLLEIWNMSQSGNSFANKFCLDFDIYPRA